MAVSRKTSAKTAHTNIKILARRMYICLSLSLSIICIYIYIYTHAHYIYIYIYICICIYIYIDRHNNHNNNNNNNNNNNETNSRGVGRGRFPSDRENPMESYISSVLFKINHYLPILRSISEIWSCFCWAETLAHWNPTSCQKKHPQSICSDLRLSNWKFEDQQLWKPTVVATATYHLIMQLLVCVCIYIYTYRYIYIYTHVYMYYMPIYIYI